MPQRHRSKASSLPVAADSRLCTEVVSQHPKGDAVVDYLSGRDAWDSRLLTDDFDLVADSIESLSLGVVLATDYPLGKTTKLLVEVANVGP